MECDGLLEYDRVLWHEQSNGLEATKGTLEDGVVVGA